MEVLTRCTKGEEDERITKGNINILDMKEQQSARNGNVWFNSI